MKGIATRNLSINEMNQSIRSDVRIGVMTTINMNEIFNVLYIYSSESDVQLNVIIWCLMFYLWVALDDFVSNFNFNFFFGQLNLILIIEKKKCNTYLTPVLGKLFFETFTHLQKSRKGPNWLHKPTFTCSTIILSSSSGSTSS